MPNLKAVPAALGAKGFDCLAPINDTILQAAWDDGCRFCVRYIHNIQAAEIDCIVRNNFAFMLVTYADNWSGQDARDTAKGHGYPVGATLWLDVESVTVPSPNLIADINGWGRDVRTVFDPGGYFGCQQLLTWQEMTQLVVDRYWASTSLVVDRNGQPSRPAMGWTMQQIGANEHKYGSVVDFDFIMRDAKGRVPTWAVAV